MIIGIPREVKDDEYRVAITPAGVRELTSAGHTVFVEAGAGVGSSMPDDEFRRTGAEIIAEADDVWAESDLVCKVKEPVPSEYKRLGARRGPDSLHLPAPRRLQGVHRCPCGRGQCGHRLRDGAPPRQFTSSVGPDERGGRSYGAPYGGAPSHAPWRGPRCAGGRRPWSARGQGRDSRSGSLGYGSGHSRRGHAFRRLHPGP